MYKNVSNQCTIGLILLFSSYFTANAQVNSENSPIAYANVGVKSDHPPSNLTNTTKPVEADTSWKPIRRVWGLAFGDFYFLQHADAAGRGGETNYSGVPANRNAYQFRRIYLGYDYDINKKFTAEILLASEPSGNTAPSGTTSISNSDNLADNKMAFYIKNFDLRWKGVWNGTDFVIGEMLTPAFPMLTEKIWGYRSIERTISDFHRTNAYDVGASLQGAFDPTTKNFGYNVMIGNNSTATLSSAANANTGFYKAFYGDVYAKFMGQRLIFDLYADYITTNPTIPATATTPVIGQQEHNMIKGFAAWTTPKITFGLEAYTQHVKNGVTATQAGIKTAENAQVFAISIYSHGAIYKDKLGFFARYDSYNPDDDFNAANVYTPNTNLTAYNPYTKEHFATAGLDFTPAKNIHFMPNLWFIDYKDERAPGTTGYVPENHILVYRLTFFFQFGR
ncbi:hypothetical protein KXD93_21730 [Mucilaginibacter sp. BJC16-A38]|uniref:hypothetical protein n=1 Tax=Mucilaginibacter phenanthrenivorans TaxID=1234842 RepID=UPI002158158C|nr:hypothetical protein [Mucilaginibacter phenanthrenivorans]MCR8560288.1 hypothetical protein [Mucilaginibacter phenanthrenivorans]